MMNDGCNSGGAILRRADWRFLLPRFRDVPFENLVLLGGPAGMTECLLELGVARRVSCGPVQHGCADALIILRDAKVHWEEAVRCLRNGGILYWEIDRRLPSYITSTPERILRALRTSGLSPVGIYAVKPHFERCELYLPLRAPEALRWYVTSLYTPASPTGRLLETALRALTGLEAQRFARLAPCYAVTAAVGGAETDVPSVLGHLGLQQAGQGDIDVIMLTDGSSRIALLPFASSGTVPSVVVKIPRLERFNEKIETEQTTLSEIVSQLDPGLRESIPQPLGIIRSGGLAIGIESYCRGHSMLRTTARWGTSMDEKLDDLRLAAKWLGEFHHRTQVDHIIWAGAQSGLDEMLIKYSQYFSLTVQEESLFNAVRQLANSLRGRQLPMVWQHRDFNVWNIFRDGNELSVIDWEGGRIGAPLCDLLHFVTHWHECAQGLVSEAEQVQGFRQLFFGPRSGSGPVRAIHQVISDYLERLQIDAEFIPVMLVYTWVELAVRRFDQQKALRKAIAQARSNNRSIAFIEVLAAHVPQLFGGLTQQWRVPAAAAV